jgi:hypothetical protein
MWADSINRYCDSSRIGSDLNTKLCLLAFLNARPIDPRKLN